MNGDSLSRCALFRCRTELLSFSPKPIYQDPANYEFSYEVQDAAAGLDFGHREMRKDMEATGTYHVLLPDGRTQIVDYIADQNGYRPMVRYEGTATYPAPGPARPGQEEGYRY